MDVSKKTVSALKRKTCGLFGAHALLCRKELETALINSGMGSSYIEARNAIPKLLEKGLFYEPMPHPSMLKHLDIIEVRSRPGNDFRKNQPRYVIVYTAPCGD